MDDIIEIIMFWFLGIIYSPTAQLIVTILSIAVYICLAVIIVIFFRNYKNVILKERKQYGRRKAVRRDEY